MTEDERRADENERIDYAEGSEVTQELKPCPFCGGEATFSEYDETKPGQSFGLVVNHIEGCFLHQAMTMEDYRTMLAAWNTRPTPDMAAVVEALELVRSFGCPLCNGDCASANPPVMACPMAAIDTALQSLRGQP